MIRALGMLFIVTSASLPVAGNDSSRHAFPPEVQTRLQAVLNELQEVEEELRPIRREAERDEELAETKSEIEADVLAEVKDRFEGASETLDRLLALRERAGNAAGNSRGGTEESVELQRELNSLNDELQSMVSEVRELPEFSERIEFYEDRLEDAMKEISPDAESLLTRRNALHIQFHRLQREALEGVRGEEAPDAGEAPDPPTEWIIPPSRRR